MNSPKQVDLKFKLFASVAYGILCEISEYSGEISGAIVTCPIFCEISGDGIKRGKKLTWTILKGNNCNGSCVISAKIPGIFHIDNDYDIILTSNK